jgi:hypothetical protein
VETTLLIHASLRACFYFVAVDAFVNIFTGVSVDAQHITVWTFAPETAWLVATPMGTWLISAFVDVFTSLLLLA